MSCSRDRHSGLRVTLPLGMALSLLIPLALRADDSATLKHRFTTEAPLAWKEYQTYAERLQGTMETVWSLEGKVQERRRFERKGNSNCQLSVLEWLFPKPNNRVSGYNASYSFSIERKTADGAWALTKFRSGPKDDEAWKPGASTLRSVCIHTTTAELPDLVRLPQFRVAAASTVQRGGKDLCQISYETQGGEGKGTLLLDPNRFWTLSSYTLHRKESGGSVVNNVEIELREPAAKYPIPKRSVLVSDVTPTEKPKFHSETVTEFDLKEISRVPDDKEFTLSAFGLPEPGGPAAKRTPWYLWLLGGAAVSALIAVGFRYLRRRAVASTA